MVRLTNITLWLRKQARAARVEEPLLFFLRLHFKCSLIKVITLTDIARSISLMHVREILLHLLRREHRHIGDAHRLEYMLLEVVIQLQTCRPLEDNTSPVNTGLYAISVLIYDEMREQKGNIRYIPTYSQAG